MSAALPKLVEVLASFTIALAIMLVGLAIERRRNFPWRNSRAALFNILYFAPASILQKMLAPAGAVASGFMIGRVGGGLIALPGEGWRIVPAALLYIAAMDMGEYWFHRAQHRIPFLWAMHELHHSDVELNITTSVRHCWAEYLLKSVTIYLAVGLVFRASSPVVFFYWLAAFYNYFVHMALPTDLGRLGRVLNSPRYHRIHHSCLPEHAGCNYAGLFSLYDRLFGTYRTPFPGECPPTGLVSGDRPSGPIAALAWPFTRLAPRLAAGTVR